MKQFCSILIFYSAIGTVIIVAAVSRANRTDVLLYLAGKIYGVSCALKPVYPVSDTIYSADLLVWEPQLDLSAAFIKTYYHNQIVHTQVHSSTVGTDKFSFCRN